jgi:hypothetical protein
VVCTPPINKYLLAILFVFLVTEKTAIAVSLDIQIFTFSATLREILPQRQLFQLWWLHRF